MSVPFWKQVESIIELRDHDKIAAAQAEYELVQNIYDGGDDEAMIQVEEYYGDGIYLVLLHLSDYINELKDKTNV